METTKRKDAPTNGIPSKYTRKKKKKQSNAQKRPSVDSAKKPPQNLQNEAPAEAQAQVQAAGKKNKSKKAKKKTKTQETTPEEKPRCDEQWVRQVFPPRKGTLSDRLNPGHSYFDSTLRTLWKTLTKSQRKAIVEEDQRVLQGKANQVASISFPFKANEDDHCETSLQAYKDIAIFLDLICAKLHKARADLTIYDPYYCAGSVIQNLGELGFTSVYNKCEDFYKVIKEKQVPAHDVLVTNPPYSTDHVKKLMEFATSNNKPFFFPYAQLRLHT